MNISSILFDEKIKKNKIVACFETMDSPGVENNLSWLE